ncbi:MAG TPA: hypothetical protein VEF55_10595 [Candidatus Binatia bacterium]|nr:hypothetical protein [Candidatus Binatia bacterium]
MTRLRQLIAWLGLSVAAGCTGSQPPPAELSGLWSAGQAACQAGVGVEFGQEAIEAVYEDERQTLFLHPQYQVEALGDEFRVRISYDLPRVIGGARSAGAHGVVVLAREGAAIAPVSHNLVDPRTGAARLRIAEDPAVTALTLTPCGDHPWREPLRGRSQL